MIKAIKPDVSFVELLYNLVFRRKFYYDNSDGVLTNKIIIHDVCAVMRLTPEEISANINSSKHGKFQTDPMWCILHNVSRSKHSRTVAKWLNYQSIGEWYDVAISVTENLRFAE